jgi:hypothetical protein
MPMRSSAWQQTRSSHRRCRPHRSSRRGYRPSPCMDRLVRSLGCLLYRVPCAPYLADADTVKSTMFRARAQELRPPITPCDVFPFGYPGVISPSRVRILSPRSSVIFGLGSACMVRKFSLSGAVGFSFQKLHSQNLICDQPAQIRELPEFRVHSSLQQQTD